MIELAPSRWAFPPRAHQLAGAKTLLKKPVYGLFWEMRLGKTYVVVVTADTLFEAGELDAVVVACPAQVKPVWADKELGEIKKHGFAGATVWDYSAKTLEQLPFLLPATKGLYIVASYEFLRQESAQKRYWLAEALAKELKGKRYWLVMDEGVALGNHVSNQHRAVAALREGACRATMLDGTPIGNSPLEQYAKFKLLDPRILGFDNFFHFKNAHGEFAKDPVSGRRLMRKFGSQKAHAQLTGFKGQDRIDAKVRPFCEYLEQRDAMDMKEPVETLLQVPLGPKAWRAYRSLRDEMMAELDRGTLLVQHAHVKALRLAQVCAGFLGGFVNEATMEPETEEVGDESTKMIMEWLRARLAERPSFKCVVWARWRPELERLNARMYKESMPNGLVMGGSRCGESVLNPQSGDYKDGFVLLAQPQASRFGVNYSLADTQVFLSQDYDRVTRAQAAARIQAVKPRADLTVDVLVTGPDGQRTIVHDIVAAVRAKEEVARRTAERWKLALRYE